MPVLLHHMPSVLPSAYPFSLKILPACAPQAHTAFQILSVPFHSPKNLLHLCLYPPAVLPWYLHFPFLTLPALQCPLWQQFLTNPFPLRGNPAFFLSGVSALFPVLWSVLQCCPYNFYAVQWTAPGYHSQTLQKHRTFLQSGSFRVQYFPADGSLMHSALPVLLLPLFPAVPPAHVPAQAHGAHHPDLGQLLPVPLLPQVLPL